MKRRDDDETVAQFRRIVGPLLAAGRVDMARRAARAYKLRPCKIHRVIMVNGRATWAP